MQGRQYLYFLLSEDGRSYYVQNGVVLMSSSPRPLIYTPDGWQDIEIQNVRNTKYFGIDRSFSLSLDFVQDGAQILKNIYLNNGIEGKLFLSIAKQQLFFDATHYGYYYTLMYRGEIDFSQYNHTGEKVTVNIMEGGISKLIKANENTKYDIPMSVSEIANLDGVDLLGTNNYAILRSFAAQAMSHKQIIPFIKTTTEGYFFHMLFQNQIGFLDNLAFNEITGDDLNVIDGYILEATDAISLMVTVSGTITGSGGSAGQEWFMETGSADATLHQTVSMGTFSIVSSPTPQAFSLSGNITLAKGERLFIYRMSTSFNNSGFWTYNDDTRIAINSTDHFAQTNCSFVRPLWLLQQIIDKITGGGYTVTSTLLEAQRAVAITCGNAIRRLSNPVIKTSLSDFFQAFNSIFGVSLNITGPTSLSLELKSDSIDYTSIIDLGAVTKLKLSPAQEYIFNTLKVGYQEQNYDDVNGKQEFNNTYGFTTPITRLTKELNLVSPYRADCYGIEFTRINMDGKTTSDNEADNNVFLLHLKASGYTVSGIYTRFDLDRSLNAGATGVLFPATVFNIFLSPKRNLLRNGNFIRAGLYKQDAKWIRFVTTEKNDDLVADGITENADVEVASLDDPLFTANLFEFETRVPLTILEMLALNPLSVYRFTYNDIEFIGVTVKTGMKGNNDSRTFQLLSAPTNDLSLLEGVFE